MPPEDFEGMEDIAASLIVKPEQKDISDGQPVTKGKEQEQKPVKESVAASEEDPEESQRESVDVETEGEGEQLADPAGEEDIDVDAIELEVTVDGVTKRVPIAELKKRYSFEGAVEQRLAEVTKGREFVAKQANELGSIIQHQMARLQSLDAVLAQAEGPPQNWDELRIKDPTKYLFERERYRESQERRGRIQQEHAKLMAQQQELERAALAEYSQSEYRELARKDPDFANPKTAPAARKQLFDTAGLYGFTQQEVEGVLDHRAILVLRDAARWREHQAKQTRASTEARAQPKLLLKPGVKKASVRTTEQKQMKALRDKARSSGKVDDIAATLLVREPAGR